MTSSGPDISAGTTDTPQRCSDTEREKASAIVRDAAAEGRLSMEELEERLSLIYAAKYRHELAAVYADLPQTTRGAGWTAVLTLAWHQLSADLAGLFGKDRTPLTRRRKIVVALTVLAAVALLIGLITMFVHGFVEDGPDHHEFGDD